MTINMNLNQFFNYYRTWLGKDAKKENVPEPDEEQDELEDNEQSSDEDQQLENELDK